MKPGWRNRVVRGLALVALSGMGGCAMVGVSQVKPHEYFNERRADIMDAGRLSDSSTQALNVVALTADSCQQAFKSCIDTVLHSPGLDDEQRLSASAELWLARAIKADHGAPGQPMDDAALDAYLQAARSAYAYLFFSERKPAQRAFDIRQMQVIDFYNFAVQRTVSRFFARLPQLGTRWETTPLAGWTVFRPLSDLQLSANNAAPIELIPASGLRFKGLRNTYRRDGFGTAFVAVGASDESVTEAPWRLPAYVPMTGALVFEGSSLDQVMATDRVQLVARDPYRDDSMTIGDSEVPLAANFTAAYGVWLARSGFARQSIRSLLGREGGITTPRVLLMQPYDPDRLTVVMLHGLASSPEAWINVSNEVMGDRQLRRHYQVWEVYYPTNAPIAVNLAAIRQALDETIQHFDPGGHARASNHMVLVGHSMGGVIARLLVSSSSDELWKLVPQRPGLSAARRERLHQRLAPYLQFQPMPQVTRAVFLSTPHRGTPYAQTRLARWIGALIRLPANVLKTVAGVADLLKDDAGQGPHLRVGNSVENLSDDDPFIKAAADLPISTQVRYNSIIGVYKRRGAPLASTSDGVVPYASSHLDGAESELIVPSWHSVQETPEAILELRRILRVQWQSLPQTAPSPTVGLDRGNP